MGTIQNSFNQAIGSIGTAVAIGEHLKQEKKANEFSEKQDELKVKELEYENEKDKLTKAKQDFEISAEMRDNPIKNAEGEIITDPKEYKQTQMDNEMQTIMKYKQGKRKQKAQEAFNELYDEYVARADLNFNIQKRTEQIEILKGGKK